MALQHPLIPAPAKDHSLPTPAAGLTTADLARLRHSLDSSVSDNTRKMYASAWHSFEAWAQARGVLPLPASPPLIAAYLAYLAEERRLSVATIQTTQGGTGRRPQGPLATRIPPTTRA